jgi:hypothetical protein
LSSDSQTIRYLDRLRILPLAMLAGEGKVNPFSRAVVANRPGFITVRCAFRWMSSRLAFSDCRSDILFIRCRRRSYSNSIR